MKPANSDKELSNILRALITARGLTQSDIATQTGLSRRTVIRIYSGDKVQSDTLRDVLKILKPYPADRAKALLAWLKLELGAEDYELIARTLSKSPAALANPTLLSIQRSASKLSEADQKDVAETLNDPHLIACVKQFVALRRITTGA